MVLRAGHDQLEIGAGGHSAGKRFPEAGPAGAAVVFAAGGEQRQGAAGAHKGARALLAVESTAERSFGAFAPQHLEGGRAEPGAPLGLAQGPGRIAGGRGCLRPTPRQEGDEGGQGGGQTQEPIEQGAALRRSREARRWIVLVMCC